MWYFKVLARQPHLVLLGIIVFSVATIIVSLTRTFPDFSDPTLGFESRGTEIGQRLTAWKNLLDETGPNGLFVANPDDLIVAREHPISKDRQPQKNSGKKKKKKEKIKFNKKIKLINKLNALNATANYDLVNFEEYDDNETFSLRHDHYDYGKNLSFVPDDVNNERIMAKKKQWKIFLNQYPPQTSNIHIPTDGFFCESPNKEYAHLVVKRINHNLTESMLEINAILASCDLEQRVTHSSEYRAICQRELTSNNCCRPWNLWNYIAFLSNKTSCFDIEESDVFTVKVLLLECFQYYHNLKLGNDCTRSRSCRVPNHCAQNNAVYNILHYLTDIDFIKQNDTNEFLSSTMIFLPIARSTKSLKYYHEIMETPLSNDLVAVDAIDMGLKNALFDEYLLLDGWLVGLGGIFITLCMWMYTTSLFVTLMAIVAVIFSLGITYFIYTLVFELSFFPFMNLLAVVVVVGIGADDAFIFVKIWQCVLTERVKASAVVTTSDRHSDILFQTMSYTFRHAALSMLTTSLTTACAFYASYVSSITAVRCFGIFSGTAIIINYILMISWLPACISIAEKMSCLSFKFKNLTLLRLSFFKSLSHAGTRIENFIISIVLYLPYLCIVVLGSIGVVSCILVFYYPKLKLPDTSDFKLFASNHPFELYDSEYKSRYWFEKAYTSMDTFKMPLRFVWGILPVDHGNYFDPFSRGKLYLDETFSMSSIESQIWLLGFCKSLKNQTFYSTTMSPWLPNCFIEKFITWMSRRCMDKMADIDRSPCCENSTFPYDPPIFEQCILESISSLYQTPREYFIPGVAGPKFGRKLGTENADGRSNDSRLLIATIKAVVIEYDSNQAYTMSYTKMSEFFNNVEFWFRKQLESAPDTMRNGWFVSDLDFYDLQQTLSMGTLLAIILAMSVALLVLLLVTLNILISIYAILAVTFTITTTIAILILLGWKLNVLESVAVSSAIGLAVDFSLHYGVHYRFSPDTDRETATKFSLKRMIGPTIMAATTTGVAGALMLPSNVLAYIQIGIFLVVVMTVSWIYSTFFLMSLLRVIGPEYGFGQFRYPQFGIKRDSGNKAGVLAEQRNNHQNIGSEKLLSATSSAAGDLANSETHELDSIVKSMSLDSSQPINFDRMVKKQYPSYPRENSPSSAITIVNIPDDGEH